MGLTVPFMDIRFRPASRSKEMKQNAGYSSTPTPPRQPSPRIVFASISEGKKKSMISRN
jgi:hypothetical protein